MQRKRCLDSFDTRIVKTENVWIYQVLKGCKTMGILMLFRKTAENLSSKFKEKEGSLTQQFF